MKKKSNLKKKEMELDKLTDKYMSLQEKGNIVCSVVVAKQALQLAEKVFGPDHLNVACAQNSLGIMHAVQNKYVEAEMYFKRSLEIHDKVVQTSKKPVDVAPVLINLALLYRTHGQYGLAEPLYKRALAITLCTYGSWNIGQAPILYDLGELEKAQKNYVKAEEYFKSALDLWKMDSGPDTPNVALNLESMADIYRKTGREKDAEKLDKRIAAIRAKESVKQ